MPPASFRLLIKQPIRRSSSLWGVVVSPDIGRVELDDSVVEVNVAPSEDILHEGPVQVDLEVVKGVGGEVPLVPATADVARKGHTPRT